MLKSTSAIIRESSAKPSPCLSAVRSFSPGRGNSGRGSRRFIKGLGGLHDGGLRGILQHGCFPGVCIPNLKLYTSFLKMGLTG